MLHCVLLAQAMHEVLLAHASVPCICRLCLLLHAVCIDFCAMCMHALKCCLQGQIYAFGDINKIPFFFVHPSTGHNAHMSGMSCIAHYLLLIMHYSLFVAHHALLIVRCLSCIAHYLLLIIHCSLSVAHHALLIICCSSCVAHCLVPKTPSLPPSKEQD